MFALFHLIFEFIRISILSTIYAGILWLVFSKVFKYSKLKIYYIFPILFISLFIWRFSHWRNNAFGDNGYVPISEKYYLHDIDGVVVSLENRDHKIDTKNSFTITGKLYCENNFLYVSDRDKYHIFDIKNENIYKNLTTKEFESRNGNVNKLMSIGEFHSDHWNTLLILLL